MSLIQAALRAIRRKVGVYFEVDPPQIGLFWPLLGPKWSFLGSPKIPNPARKPTTRIFPPRSSRLASWRTRKYRGYRSMPLFIQNPPPVGFLDCVPISVLCRDNSVSAEILEVVLFGPQRAKTPWFGTGRVWKMVRFLRRLPLQAP